jgi:hypothetical protein
MPILFFHYLILNHWKFHPQLVDLITPMTLVLRTIFFTGESASRRLQQSNIWRQCEGMRAKTRTHALAVVHIYLL